MRVLPAGQHAVLVEVDDLDQVLSLYAALQDAVLPGVVDLIPAARTVLVVLEPGVGRPSDVRDLLPTLQLDVYTRSHQRPLEVPATYDGEDLPFVSAHLGLSPDEFVAWHTSREWTVAFAGFAPGFGYLVSGGHTLPVPRLTSPRTKVPAGSIAMGGEFTGIYPRPSPGGWRIVGSTDLDLFDVDGDPPAQLSPGRPVTFVPTS